MSVSLNPAINNAGTNKIYVPVQKSSLLYSHFEHVSGFVANKGQNGVSVSKIQILNALIDHLSSVKNGKQPAAVKNASPEQIDSLIDNYQTQIKQAMKAAENAPYIMSGTKAEPGALFSIDA